MRRLNQLRNLAYYILVIFIMLMPFLTAFLLSNNSSYFGSTTNFAITDNRSNKTDSEIYNAIEKIANDYHIAITKKVFVEKNNHIESATLVTGNVNKLKNNIPKKEKIILNPSFTNADIRTNYAVFGNINQQIFFQKLSDLGVAFYTWNPQSPRNILTDLYNLIVNYHFNLILIFWLLGISLLNSIILFNNRRKNALRKLFQGNKPIYIFFHQFVSILAPFLISGILGIVCLTFLTNFIAPDIVKLSLISSITLYFTAIIFLSILTIFLIFLFNYCTLTEILKNKGNYQLINIFSNFVMALALILFVLVLNMNHQEQLTVNNLVKEQNYWYRIKNFNIIRFNSFNSNEKTNIAMGNQIINAFSEKQLFLSTISQPDNIDDTSIDNALTVNTTYLKYQAIYKKNNEQISSNSFKKPITILLTEPNTSQKAKQKISALYDISISDIGTQYIKNDNFYDFQLNRQNSSTSHIKRPFVVVLNFHKIQQQYPDNLLLVGNLATWSTQGQLMFDKKNVGKYIYNRLPKLSPYVSNTNSTTRIRSNLKQTIMFRSLMLKASLIVSLCVMIMSLYFAVFVLFESERKNLFLEKIYGNSLWKRYKYISLSLIVSIIPSFIYSVFSPKTMKYFLITILFLIFIFVYRVMKSEKQSYTILKGKI